MMLRALWTWLVPGEQGYIRTRGDAQGVLAAIAFEQSHKRSGHARAMSFSLTEALHLWSEDNGWAQRRDASRAIAAAEGGELACAALASRFGHAVTRDAVLAR